MLLKLVAICRDLRNGAAGKEIVIATGKETSQVTTGLTSKCVTLSPVANWQWDCLWIDLGVLHESSFCLQTPDPANPGVGANKRTHCLKLVE